MDADLLNLLIADSAVALAFCALMISLATVSRHPALGGGIRYSLGHLGFAVGSSLFIVMMGPTAIEPAHQPAVYAGALLASVIGGASMVHGMARLLEHPGRRAIARACWIIALLLVALGALPLGLDDPMRLSSDIANAAVMFGLSVVLLFPYAAPYRLPALSAGVGTSFLAVLYLVGAVQGWTGVGDLVLPPYEQWAWVDLALWNTINLCVMMLASFRALIIFVRRSRTDALTHCLNRSGFEDEIQLLALRTSPATPLAVLALDIDHFKSINDRFGHAAGDAYLASFAQALQGCVRQSDVVARIGGEEFVAVLVGAHAETGERVAGKILEAIRRLEVRWEGQPVRTTVSIGIVRGVGLASVELLLRHADRALYEAKAAGRDRAVTATVDAQAPAPRKTDSDTSKLAAGP